MIELCLTNLGKYNEGELVYTRLVLPATTEEIYAAYDEIGVADGTMYEEAFISDYETGLLNSIPDDLRCYFDFESYGRDMEINGHFIETDSGYIEIFNKH